MDSAQPLPPQVLPPNRALVVTSWSLAVAAMTLGVFGLAGDLMLGRHGCDFEDVIWTTVPTLLFWSVEFALWARCGFIKSLMTWLAGSLGATLGILLMFGIPGSSLVGVLVMSVIGVPMMLTGFAFSARFVAELVLHPIREHPRFGVWVLLVATASLACLTLPIAVLKELQFGAAGIRLIPIGALALASAAPLFIDKRRVPRVPFRIGIPIWLGWCSLIAHMLAHDWEWFWGKAGLATLVGFNAVLLYLAWRNSRPQPPVPANPAPV